MSSSDMQVFDPRSLQDKVIERIRSSFLELIPEDAWDELVGRELEKFFQTTKKTGYGASGVNPPEIEQMIHGALKSLIAERLAKDMAADGWFDTNYATNDQPVGERMTEALREIAPDLIAALMGSIMRESVQNMRDHMSKGY